MGLRITSNILSLGVQRNLANTTRAIARSLQRLSSGSRINTGRDDPAGLAMASGLEAQRRGLIQAVRNLNDSRGFLETADGALATQTNIVQRMRELAVQASNGTLNDATRKYLDNECQALLSEFTRLTTQTQFNGVNLIDGSFTTTAIQVGAQKGQTISVNLTSMQASQVFTKSTTVASAGTGTFQSRTSFGTGSHPRYLTAKDVNGDGIADLINTDFSTGTVGIALGNGNGTFRSRTTVQVGGSANPSSVVAIDVNGDSKIDLLTSDSGTDTMSIFLGNGNGTFQTRTTSSTGSAPISLNVIDLNGDGKLDSVVTDTGGVQYTASILLGNGDGTFKARATVSTGLAPEQVFASDLNGDGKPDLLVADSTQLDVSIFIANGDGTFQTRTTVRTGSAPWDVISADVNGDGKLDILDTDANNGGGNGNTISVLLGNGNGTFLARSTVRTGANPSWLSAADLNGDGVIDLITGDQDDNTISIAMGNGNGTFQARTTIASGVQPYAAITSDLNGDGVLDLASVDNSDNTVSVYLAITNPSTTSTTAAVVSLATQSTSQDALGYLDTALSYINSARANIGALQSRLDFATSVNMNTIENISAARSQIMDTDMAAETAEFARLQILQKAGIAVLAQANGNSQLSLKLLENL